MSSWKLWRHGTKLSRPKSTWREFFVFAAWVVPIFETRCGFPSFKTSPILLQFSDVLRDSETGATKRGNHKMRPSAALPPTFFPQSWASDNHSTLAIGTVQSNIFDFNLVAEGVRHEDEDQSASKHDTSASRLPTPVGISQDSHDTVRLHWQGTQATNKDTPFSDTMDPLWIWSIGPNPCKTAFLQSQD